MVEELSTYEIMKLAEEEKAGNSVDSGEAKELSTYDILQMTKDEEATAEAPVKLPTSLYEEVESTPELSTYEILQQAKEEYGEEQVTEVPKETSIIDRIRFAPRNVSENQITEWSKQFNLDEDKVRKYVELKGGVINALQSAEGDPKKAAHNMRNELDKFVTKHGADVYKKSDLALMTSFVASDEALAMFKEAPREVWSAVKNALVLPLFMDRASGSEEERKFKEFLDSDGQLGGDIVLSRLMTDIAAGTITGGAAVSAAKKLAPKAVSAAMKFSPIKSLAERLGAGAKVARAAAKVDIGAKAIALGGASGALTGAATSREGKMLEDTITGLAFGSAIPVLAGAATGFVKGTVKSTQLLKGMVTKQISSVAREAGETVEARKQTERMLFEMAQTGDTSILPESLDELENIAETLGVTPKQINTAMKDEEVRKITGVSSKLSGLSEKQIDKREIAAKKSLLFKKIEGLNETEIRNKEFVLDIVEGKRQLPTDLQKLKGVAERLKIKPKEVEQFTGNAEFKSKLGIGDVVNKADKQKLEKAAINEVILRRFEGLDANKIKAERELYRISKGDVKIDWTKDNVNKFADLLIDPKAVKNTMKSSKISAETGTKLAVEQMPEGDKAKLKAEAIRTVLLRKAETELHGFASDYSPDLMRQRGDLFNANSIINSIDSAESFQNALGTFPHVFGEEIINKAKAASIEKGWRAGTKVLEEQAKEILGAAKKEGLENSFKSSRDYLKKIIHDEGQDPEKIFSAFTDYRKYREAIKIANGKEVAQEVKRTPFSNKIWNIIAPDHQKIDDIERRWDLDDLAIANLNINNKTQIMDNHIAVFKNKMDDTLGRDVTALMRSGDWDGWAFHQYVNNPSSDVTKLTSNKKMQEALPSLERKFRIVDDSILDEVEPLGVKVDRRKNHISNIPVNPIEGAARVQGAVNENDVLGMLLDEDASTRKFLSKIEGNKEVKEILDAVEYLTQTFDEMGIAKIHKIENAKQLRRALTTIADGKDIKASVSPMLQFTRARSESQTIPRILLETDPRAILNKNIRSFLSSAYLKDDIKTVYRNMKILQNIGANAARVNNYRKVNIAETDAAALERYLNKLTGSDQGLSEQVITSKFQKYWVNKVYQKGLSENEVKKAIEVPNKITSIAQNLIYAALFSAPKTAIRNSLQTGMNVSSVIGGKIGRELAASSTMETMVGMLTPGTPLGNKYKEIGERLFREGKAGREASGVLSEMTQAKGVKEKAKALIKTTKREFTEGGKLAGADVVTQMYAKGMLAVFEKFETNNRIATAILSEKYVEAIKKGLIKSEDWFKDVTSPGVKRKLTSLANEGNWTEVNKLFEDQALQKVQFIYNEANKANMVKDLGPVFGALLRYPTEAISGMIGQLKAGQTDALVEKLVYPAVWLSLAGAYVNQAQKRSERFQAAKEALYGKGNLPGVSPLATLSALDVRGNTPLAFKITSDLFGAASGNEKSLEDLIKQITTFVPGKPLANILMDDVYTRLIKGDTDVPVSGAEKAIKKGVVNSYRKLKRKGKEAARDVREAVFD